MDGALVYSCGLDSSAVDWLIRRGLPMVFVDQEPVPGIPSVNVDDRGGARAAAQHLVDLGHRRIGIVNRERTADDPGVVAATPSGELHVSHQRMLGWTDALDAAGIEPVVTRESVRPPSGSPARPSARRTPPRVRVRELLGAGPADRGAVLLRRDGLPAWCGPPRSWACGCPRTSRSSASTTTRWPAGCARRSPPSARTCAAKGRAATAALTAAIEAARTGTKPSRAKQVVLPTELVVRDSTAPPAG